MSFGGGSGGNYSVSGASDVTLNNPIDSQVLAYDESSSKWQNKSVDGSASTADQVSFVPSGTITSENVQAAMVELDTEKAALAYTGTFGSFPAAASSKGQAALATDMNGGTVYISNGTTWLQAAAGVMQTGGKRVAQTQLTTTYSIKNQSSPTTFTDVGMQIVIGSPQAQSYDVLLTCVILAQTATAFTTGSSITAQLRIVDAAGTKVGASSSYRFYGDGTAGGPNYQAVLRFNVPAGYVATTWKLQARLNQAPPVGVQDVGIYAGMAFGTPSNNLDPTPALLTATTVG